MPANDLGREKIPQWPEIPIPPGTKNIVEKFYQLVDVESEEAFRQWTELFIPDGV